LSRARRLETLADFCNVASETAPQSKNCVGSITVGDITVASDTWTITLGKQDLLLGPRTSAIFRMLVLNTGQPVSRDRLRRAASVIDASDVDGHISKLRMKLGMEYRKRIQTIKGVGYMYISPDRTNGEFVSGHMLNAPQE
jgi:DNA-binding response OmpR family regulator